MKVLAISQATQSENTSSDFMACIGTRLHGTSSIYRSVSDAVLNLLQKGSYKEIYFRREVSCDSLYQRQRCTAV